jgi:hypothetical protein
VSGAVRSSQPFALVTTLVAPPAQLTASPGPVPLVLLGTADAASPGPPDQRSLRAIRVRQAPARRGPEGRATGSAVSTTSPVRPYLDTSSKLVMRVRFPSPAPPRKPRSEATPPTWAFVMSGLPVPFVPATCPMPRRRPGSGGASAARPARPRSPGHGHCSHADRSALPAPRRAPCGS